MKNASTSVKVSYLGMYTSGHDNNFNLVRFIAALLVLVTHSFALATGQGDSEPLRVSLGVTLGSIAVDVFFVTSGFLVSGSLLYRQNLKEFLAARALRIFPALWLSLFLTVVVLGLFFTTMNYQSFFTEIGTWKFLLRNGVLLMGLAWELPGTFMENPAKGSVNGSLWSLPSEVKMYLLLAVLWFTAGAFKAVRVRLVSMACVGIALAGVALSLTYYRVGSQSNFIYLGAMFFSGAALQVLKDRVVMSNRIGICMLAILVTTAFADRTAFEIAYRLLLPYVVLYLATIPTGKIRSFNEIGDYSYGLYIYAFPVQQALVVLWIGINPYELMITSFLVTMFFAIGSWYLVEKRALALKARFN